MAGEMPWGYEGNICPIPLGQLGVVSDIAPGQVPYNALIKAYDVDYGPGYIQKAPGSMRYNATQFANPIVALIDYWPDLVTQRMLIATSDGSIYRDIGDKTFNSNTAITTGLGNIGNSSFFLLGGAEVAGNPRKVFFYSGGQSQLKVLEGDASTFSNIDSPAVDWSSPNFPKCGAIHRNRHWAFMGNRYYASTTGNHENFTDVSALSGTVGPGDGGDIIAAFIYKGKMILWKEGDVVYYLNDTDTSSANWYFAKLAEGFGIASVRAVVQVIDDLLAGNNTGSVTSWQAVQSFGDIESGDIFRQAKVNQFFRENTTYSGFPYMQAVFYPEKHIVFFTARTKAGTANNCLIALDVQSPNTPRYSLWKKDAAECLGLRRDINNVKRPFYGSSDGYIYLMDREDRYVGTLAAQTAYTGEFKTPHLDFRHLDPGLSHKEKVFDYLGVTFQEEGDHNLSVDVFIDGKFRQTVNFKQTVNPYVLDAFRLDTDTLGIEDEKTVWKPISGSGRRIAFRCYNSGSNENFKVSQLTVGYTEAGENATRL